MNKLNLILIPFIYKDGPNLATISVGFVGVAPAFQAQSDSAQPHTELVLQYKLSHKSINKYFTKLTESTLSK